MARMSLGTVEYKRCDNPACKAHPTDETSTRFEGDCCPICGRPFNPQRAPMVVLPRVILVDLDPAAYLRAPRCHCSVEAPVDHYYALTSDMLEAQLRCGHCGEMLWTPKELKAIRRGCKTLLQAAHAVDDARRLVDLCPHCGEAVKPGCWCPLCAGGGSPPSSSCLPAKETMLMVRTFYYRETREEVERRGYFGGGADGDL